MKDNYDFSKGKRGAVVPISPTQIRVNIPLDKEIIDWFCTKVIEAGGGDYQALINEVLREYIQQDKEALNVSCIQKNLINSLADRDFLEP